jgi:hypothetical protein
VRALRPGLGVLAALEVVLGLWTLLFPASFYADVPTIDLTPPFSEHLFRDFGAATLGLAVILTVAALWPERRLVVVALLAHLAFSTPHLVFHLGHLHGAGGPAVPVLAGLLIGSVALPLALLVVVLRARGQPEPAHSSSRPSRTGWPTRADSAAARAMASAARASRPVTGAGVPVRTASTKASSSAV